MSCSRQVLVTLFLLSMAGFCFAQAQAVTPQVFASAIQEIVQKMDQYKVNSIAQIKKGAYDSRSDFQMKVDKKIAEMNQFLEGNYFQKPLYYRVVVDVTSLKYEADKQKASFTFKQEMQVPCRSGTSIPVFFTNALAYPDPSRKVVKFLDSFSCIVSKANAQSLDIAKNHGKCYFDFMLDFAGKIAAAHPTSVQLSRFLTTDYSNSYAYLVGVELNSFQWIVDDVVLNKWQSLADPWPLDYSGALKAITSVGGQVIDWH